MPMTLVDRLPLPSLKVYTAGSVLVLSMAAYYALSATSDPSWKLNATLQRQETAAAAEEAGAGSNLVPQIAPLDLSANGTRNLTEHFMDVMVFMMHEPLCMWALINTAYCSLALFGFLIQRVVFGKLRVSEAQRVKDKFWNYVFYKFIFVFGVINVQYMDEVLLWCSWFTLVGFLHLLGQLCKDRYEYLSSSPNTSRWSHARLAALVCGIVGASLALLAAAAVWGLPAGRDTFAFMAAECVLVLASALHVCAQYALQLRAADAAGPLAYYTHLFFDSTSLLVELVHVVHMVMWSNMLVSMASLVLLMQLRHLLHELQARLRRHRVYTSLATHMSRNYPMASKEEVEKNQDNCAICWEPMKEARKLPCSHLFHNSCLCQWVQHDASCPTCRRALSGQPRAPPPAPPAPPAGAAPLAPPAAPPAPPVAAHNSLFRFDGSRYASWLPSFSVEVTRAPEPALLDAMARQVQQVFPQYGVAALAADLARTASPHRTVDNILAGRLPAPAPTPAPSPAPPPEPTASTSTATQVDNAEQAETEAEDEWSAPHRALQERKRRLLEVARLRYLQRARAPRPV